MKNNVIIGTAGHIDHGKTCLIKALSGTDTDRLKEEKQRGITIELGFADLPNDMGMDIGIIDVPGHEKFVRHMLAGIGGIDIVLLIVAADEGIMPQTTEHFEILKMLRIKKGIVVLTKIDMVEDDWLEMVEEDVRAHMKGTFLETAPVIKVSSHTGENIELLKTVILDMAKECGQRRTEKSLMRLPVDRVFTIDGFGTVITGTLMEGSLEIGDEVMLYPSCKRARVRNLQVHGNPVKASFAGQRTAINLTGIKKEDINRGNVLAAPGLMENTRILDVKIDMFDNAKRLLKNGSRVHFYYGSAETMCKVVLLENEELAKGETGYAQLRFEDEIAVKREDRFILRFYSPMETIGGGKILNSASKKKKRYDEAAVRSLKVQDTGDNKDILEEIFIQESCRLLEYQEIIKKYGGTENETANWIDELVKEDKLVKIDSQLILHRKYIDELGRKTGDLLGSFHNYNPVTAGMLKEEFRGKVKAVMHIDDSRKIDSLIDYLINANVIKEINGAIALKDFQIEYTEEQKKQIGVISEKYKNAWLEPPDLDSVLSTMKNRRIGQQLIESMYTDGKLGKLNYQYYIYEDALKYAISKLQEYLEENSSITLAEFRDMIGTSRKYAIMILEYTDSMNMTKMIGDSRVLVK